MVVFRLLRIVREYGTCSFLGSDRLLHKIGSEIEITSEVSKKALLVPDFELRTATYNQLFTSQEFALNKVGHVDFVYSGSKHRHINILVTMAEAIYRKLQEYLNNR